jgi:molybdate transport system ATP-binding protein
MPTAFFFVATVRLPMPAQRARRRSRFIRVDLHKLRLSLDGRAVIKGIDWTIRPSERWVLVGPNGAGKTQLLKLIAGDVWPSPVHASRRIYRYQDETFTDPYDIKNKIAYVGPERQDRYEHYGWNHRVESIVGTGLYRTEIPLDRLTLKDRAGITRILGRLEMQALAKRRFLTLSYGERRLVLLARALASSPKLLLLDELFNGLDTRNHERARQCLESLSRSSLPWVLSAHRSQDIPAFATHLCELKAGRIVAAGRIAARRRRTQPKRIAPDPSAKSRAAVAAMEQPLLQLQRVSVWREGARVLRELSLQIRAGECWVVHGSNGSGKSSFLQLLYGDLTAAHGGTMVRSGIESGVPIEQFKRRVGFVAPELQALHPRYLLVEEVVASGQYASIGLNDPLCTQQSDRIARALRRVGGGALRERTIRTLSYGQLRRVLFARALAYEPDMLLLDEPYAGIDERTRASLRALVARELESGVTVVMATHHRDEWPAMTSHELHLSQSRPLYCGPVR